MTPERLQADLALALRALERIRDDETAPPHVRRLAGEAWARIVWPTPPDGIPVGLPVPEPAR